jgi:hypothetical protein
MKKLLILTLLLPFLLCSCMTANQLEAEKAYYQSMVAMRAQQVNQPIFKMTPARSGEPIVLGNVSSFEIFAPPAQGNMTIPQYAHRDFTPPILSSLVQAAMPLGILYGGSLLLKEAGSGVSYNQSVSGSGNKAQWAGGNVLDSTSVPTVVTQPAPIIVNPVIVP